MNEDTVKGGEDIGALCALMVELAAKAEQQRQAIATLEARMQQEFRAVQGSMGRMRSTPPRTRVSLVEVGIMLVFLGALVVLICLPWL